MLRASSHRPRKAALAVALIAACLAVAVHAQVAEPPVQPAPAVPAGDEPLYRLPGATASLSDDAITVSYGGRTLTYVAGIGWSEGIDAPPPLVVGAEVALGSAVLAALDVYLPRLLAVRTSGEAEVRIVLDLHDLDPGVLAGLSGEGALGVGQPLTLTLPQLLLPLAQPEEFAGIELQLVSGTGQTQFTAVGPAMTYRYFPLTAPNRLVLDLIPQRQFDLPELEQALGPGATYRRINYRSGSGGSVVHVVSVAPGFGEFRVVGASRGAATVPQLASGAPIAINAGYFDTATFDAIGYLLVDHGLISLPSRNRASIAFGDGPPVIDRVRASVKLHTPTGLVELALGNGERTGVVSVPGAFAGAPDMGVLVVAEGLVVENKIGPRRVPNVPGAYALVYPPVNRQLALLDTGDRVFLDAMLEPASFEGARYAVEAGPLLLQGGLNAYRPDLEGFAVGQRILDGLTQQAAIGVRADGTVLMVVAETMRAEELIPLFQLLGARDAMRLDSGSSSTLVVDGRVVNRRTLRRVVSAIVYLPTVAWR